MSECRTPGAVYEINIGRGTVSCIVLIPPTVKARLNSFEVEQMRKQIHDAMEDILAPLFP
jgi:hypothetical protein